MNEVILVAMALILAKWLAQLGLEQLNQTHVRAHADRVPPAFEGIIDAATYAKSIQYTMATSRLSQLEDTYDCVVLVIVLLSGVLPAVFGHFITRFGGSAWSMAAFLFVIGLAFSLLSLPFHWYRQFRLEERFGFNTTTARTWWLDRLKELLLSAALGYPLLALILKLVDWTGSRWWVWAWLCMTGFQLLMLVLAPIVILPLFNKFTPLPEGTLRDRLVALGNRTGFRSQSIQVMDGSKRSRHSNAFFTGFGQFRKIVLFDTLVQQLQEVELEAVLAHEIGHYKKKHIPKMLAWSASALFAGFYAIAWLSRQQWFYDAFGFPGGGIVPAFLLFALLGGVVIFWLAPLKNVWSRRYEYEADAYAARAMQEPHSLIGALRKLNEKNLSNLTPHPIYSGFYYSHPALLEREEALQKTGPGLQPA